MAEARPDIETRLFDVRDFDLPADHYGREMKDDFPEWRDAVTASDGLIIVTPEYNHGYPGSLKSVLDLLTFEYKHKAAGIVAVSAGGWGGTRVIEALVPVLRVLGLTVTSADLHFPSVKSQFDEEGEPFDTAHSERAEKFFDELVWMARALKWGRGNLQ